MSRDNFVEELLRGSSADLKLTVLSKLYDQPAVPTVLFSRMVKLLSGSLRAEQDEAMPLWPGLLVTHSHFLYFA